MGAPAFNRALDFSYGAAAEVAPGIRRVIARNPSAFTFHGTGTYILGRGRVAVIDPGPRDEDHLAALTAALQGETVSHILITHTHLDHSPLARELKAMSGAPTHGFGPHGGGRAEDGVRVEEGGDRDFVPDVAVRDGDVIAGDGWTVTCLHTPGHTSNHVCFAWDEGRALFTGDHVMGWSTTVVAPPDGDMAAYMASLERLLARDDTALYPTHGAPVGGPGDPMGRKPQDFVRALIDHRHAREAQILAALDAGPQRIPELVARLYADVDTRLHAAAGMSVLAHLIDLNARGAVAADPSPGARALYRRV